MRLKKMTAVILSGLMLLPLTACGSASQTGSDAASSVEPEIVLDVAFENNSSEPIGAGWERAQEIIKEKSGGKMAIEVYPDSQLGDKSSLIDSCFWRAGMHACRRSVLCRLWDQGHGNIIWTISL